MATRFAVIVEMRFKHAFAAPRPVEYAAQLQPMILTPGHGSYPSGHSTQAYVIARVLCELLGAVEPTPANAGSPETVLWTQLMRQAARIAINRTVAGVHFPIDSAAGRLLGITLAEYFIRRCKPGAKPFKVRHFDGTNYGDPAGDFNPNADLNRIGNHLDDAGKAPADDSIAAVSPMLSWLWERAERECNGKARDLATAPTP